MMYEYSLFSNFYNNSSFIFLSEFLLSSFFSWLLLLIIMPILRKWFLDEPNIRSSHSQSKPRAGGVIFILTGIFEFVFKQSYIGLFCIPLALVGLLDDKYKLSSSLRYFVQIFTILFLLFNSNLFFLIKEIDSSNFSIFFIIIAGTAIINFVNFMDGIDGLVGGVMLIVLGNTLLYFDLGIVYILGAILGFLILNWFPAKVFMGDVGSTFLGALYVGILFKSTSLNQFLSMLLVSGPLLADAFFCVIRRFFASQNIFSSHKKHLYQRLVIAGFSHSQVAILYILLTLALSISINLLGIKWGIIIFIFELLIGLVLDKKYAANFTE